MEGSGDERPGVREGAGVMTDGDERERGDSQNEVGGTASPCDRGGLWMVSHRDMIDRLIS